MNELVKSISIENLLNQRAGVVLKVEQVIATLREARDLAHCSSLGFPDIEINFSGARSTVRLCGLMMDQSPKILEAWIRTIDAGAWQHLMNESGLRTFMDAKARSEWDEKIHAQEVPPLTRENIEATFSSLHEARGDMFERGVLQLFRALSWDYKTNQPFKFGKRIIMEYLFRVYGTNKERYLSTNYQQANVLDDLDRVFHILDGKPEPDHRNGWNARLSNAKRATTKIETGTYFDVKWFLKGTGHVVFKRTDLVEKLNLILAKHHPNALASEIRH